MLEINKSILTLTEKDDISYIQFNKLLEFQDKLKHCFTLKTNNIGFFREKPEIRNHSIDVLANEFQLNRNKIIQPVQTHTSNIFCFNKYKSPNVPSNDSYSANDLLVSYIDKDDQNNDIFVDQDFQDIDGFISNVNDISTILTGADCTMILMYDPVNNVFANVHSGWRGTVKHIVQRAVKNLALEYNTKPQDLICCISPAIRKECFVVKQDVVDIFIDELSYYTKKYPIILQREPDKEGNSQFNIDTQYIIKLDLRALGVSENNIIDSGICTLCNSEYFHSRRAEDDEHFNINASLMSLI